ncbi:MAG: TPM domain-containing protein [Clostridia bacterium]|nr:TPM domain-containing protein [Clostridia bacterium]
MKKHFFRFALLTLFCALFLAGAVSADMPRFVDGAGLLSSEEASTLSQLLDKISEEYACDVVVVTMQTYDGYSVQAAADDYYDENGYGYGAEASGIMLLLSMTEREWAMSTCGEAIGIFSDRALIHLEDELMPYLMYEDYAGAFSRFAENCGEILSSGGSAYRDDSGYDDGYYTDDFYGDYYDGYDVTYESRGVSPMWIPGSVVIGFIISLIVVNIMKGEMTTVRMQNGASSYEKQGSFRVTTQQDLFLYRNVNRTPRQTQQSSGSGRSGGSSVHRSSSGRSHGGRSGRF